MTTIDLSKIKPGDRVRVKYCGLEGWQEVVESADGNLYARPVGIRLGAPIAEILEHAPAPQKIEVELPAPEPGEWPCSHTKADSVYLGTDAGHVQVMTEVSGRAGIVYLRPDDAEAFALRVLSIARSLKESDQ